MGKLRDSKIKSLKPKEKLYKISYGDGLIIEVKPTGRKIFRIRYRFKGKEKTYTTDLLHNLLFQAETFIRRINRLDLSLLSLAKLLKLPIVVE
jgi:hypothetical protein